MRLAFKPEFLNRVDETVIFHRLALLRGDYAEGHTVRVDEVGLGLVFTRDEPRPARR
jgi:ATP-dependent Clp protease ATP-binding subunit ClpA